MPTSWCASEMREVCYAKLNIMRQALIVIGAFLFFCPPVMAEEGRERVEWGKYLVNAVGLCHDCHTPKDKEGRLLLKEYFLAGHIAGSWEPVPWDGRSVIFAGDLTAASGPWGTAFGKNLTPDRGTGLGEWTEADFIRALRSGVRPNGKGLSIVMPWPVFTQMTDDDLKAIWTYLQTIPAVKNKVPENLPPSDNSR